MCASGESSAMFRADDLYRGDVGAVPWKALGSLGSDGFMMFYANQKTQATRFFSNFSNGVFNRISRNIRNVWVDGPKSGNPWRLAVLATKIKDSYDSLGK